MAMTNDRFVEHMSTVTVRHLLCICIAQCIGKLLKAQSATLYNSLGTSQQKLRIWLLTVIQLW